MAKVWSFAALKRKKNNEEMKIGKIKMKNISDFIHEYRRYIHIYRMPTESTDKPF